MGNRLGQANSVTCLPKGQAGIQVFVEPCMVAERERERETHEIVSLRESIFNENAFY